jgi:hypothetical protein
LLREVKFDEIKLDEVRFNGHGTTIINTRGKGSAKIFKIVKGR